MSGVILIYCIGKRIYLSLLSHKTQDNGAGKIIQYSFPNIDDIHFEAKLLSELKKYVKQIAFPEHSDAHTVTEIGTYLFNSEILETGLKLEKSIYTGIPLEKKDRNAIISSVEKYLNNKGLLPE
ncbi:hypothetical protein KBD33_05570 [Candidatus Gracilibacteria bacterium]|nr:hypothetical protein [Candidatus Gracilibacteria bacterium]